MLADRCGWGRPAGALGSCTELDIFLERQFSVIPTPAFLLRLLEACPRPTPSICPSRERVEQWYFPRELPGLRGCKQASQASFSCVRAQLWGGGISLCSREPRQRWPRGQAYLEPACLQFALPVLVPSLLVWPA